MKCANWLSLPGMPAEALRSSAPTSLPEMLAAGATAAGARHRRRHNVTTLARLQRRLSVALWVANAAEPRRRDHNETFAARSARWRAGLAAALDDSPAALVTDALAPCSGGDMLSVLGAFPLASNIILISQEPIGDPDALLLSSDAELRDMAAAALSIFRRSRGGAFQLGHLVRPFCAAHGVLPLLLAGAGAAGLSLRGEVRRASLGGLDAIDLDLWPLSPGTWPVAGPARGAQLAVRGRLAAGTPPLPHQRRVCVRYVRADLGSLSNLSALRSSLDSLAEQPRQSPARDPPARPAGRVVGALVKAAEVAFGRADALSRLVLGADVLLQDLQTGVPWPALSAWASHVVPLGSFAPGMPLSADESSPSLERATRQRRQQQALRALWCSGREASREAASALHWRSLRGVRLGYCQFDAALTPEARAFVSATGDAPIASENDEEELGRPMHCGGLLAWRCRPDPSDSDSPSRRAPMRRYCAPELEGAGRGSAAARLGLVAAASC